MHPIRRAPPGSAACARAPVSDRVGLRRSQGPMIACMRARSLSRGLTLCHAGRRRPPLVNPLPSSWVVRFSSTKDDSSSGSSSSPSSGGSDSSSGSDGGSAADGSAPPPPELGTSGFDPSSLITPPPSAEPWSTAPLEQFLSDFPGSVSPLMADAGMYLLHGVLTTGMHIIGGVQAGVQGVHHLTGLPWWATIAVATIGVKISLLPVVVYQAGHMDRMRMAWPEIQVLRDHLATTLDKVGLLCLALPCVLRVLKRSVLVDSWHTPQVGRGVTTPMRFPVHILPVSSIVDARHPCL